MVRLGVDGDPHPWQRCYFNHASTSVYQYVWGVDDHGEAYEAKWDRDGYHGYRLDKEGEKYQRDCVLKAWSER